MHHYAMRFCISGYNDVEFTEKNFDADGETLEAGIFEEEEAEDRVKGGFQKPSSIGVSFYVSDDVQKVKCTDR